MKPCALLLAILLACTSVPTVPVAAAVFPLMAWNWAPSDSATLQQMRDCGLNVAGFGIKASNDFLVLNDGLGH